MTTEIDDFDYDSPAYRREIQECYYKIGMNLFKLQDYSEVRIPCEAGTLIVGLDVDSEATTISIRQMAKDNTLVNDIGLYPAIDRNDAMRLAGILTAWADLDELHGKKP